MRLKIKLTALLLCLLVIFTFQGCKEKVDSTDGKAMIDFYTGHDIKPIYSRSHIEKAHNRYVFDPVLQGDIVRHDFIIKNDHRDALKIQSAEGCCGSIVESYTKIIPPGQTGKISVLFLTDSHGGDHINGTIRAETNNEDLPEITIDVSLHVKEFADLNPYRLWLEGSPSEEIVERSVVIPNENYPFSITGIRTRKGVWFDYSFRQIKLDGRKAYVITVRNTRKKPGPYQDVLYIQTDHSARPEFKMRIEGRIGELADG